MFNPLDILRRYGILDDVKRAGERAIRRRLKRAMLIALTNPYPVATVYKCLQLSDDNEALTLHVLQYAAASAQSPVKILKQWLGVAAAAADTPPPRPGPAASRP